MANSRTSSGKTRTLISIFCATCITTRAEPSKQLETSRMEAKTFVAGQHTNQLQYLLYLPKAYQTNPVTRWPLMLFLHGAGERGSNVFNVSWHGPPKLVREGHDLPFLIISPQCPEKQWWNDQTLLKLLDDVERQYRVDTNRVYLTGLSMGGSGTWNLGLRHPDRFAAIAPICGGANTQLLTKASAKNVDAIKSLGIWVFHGVKDTTVPIANSERMVAALKEMGCLDVKFTKYAEADHDSWTVTYNNPTFYHWLLAHQRKP